MKTKTISINTAKNSQIGLRVVGADDMNSTTTNKDTNAGASAILTSLEDYCNALDNEIRAIQEA